MISVTDWKLFNKIKEQITQLIFTVLRTFDCLCELTEFIGLIHWKLNLWFFVKAHCLLLKPGSLLVNISGALPFTAWRKEFPRTVATWHLVQTLSCCINALFCLHPLLYIPRKLQTLTTNSSPTRIWGVRSGGDVLAGRGHKTYKTLRVWLLSLHPWFLDP